MQNKFSGIVDNGQQTFIWQAQSTPEQKEQILGWLKKDIQRENLLLQGDQPQKNVALMKWVMNQVGRVEKNNSPTPFQMLADARTGQGLLCRNMAAVFAEVVSLSGGTARVLQLSSGVGSRYDTHVVVEVWENGGWKLYDPTFNLTFFDVKEKQLNIHEVRTLLRAGKDVSFKFHGQVKYPARIEQYYVAYDQLVEYVIAILPPPSLLAKIPPFRYVLKEAIPVLFVNRTLIDRGMDAFSLHNKLYALFFFFLPVIATLSFLMAATFFVLGVRGRPKFCRRSGE
ncbi:transglutaminase-like domain-containing protein [Oleidesulfovibrio sp.]|uniref:transglutaminase-like domain-containing protein n=1 Tax=Oleidesulfovibrio sp. TaxID=2909707 RepID=UPI003A84E3E6